MIKGHHIRLDFIRGISSVLNPSSAGLSLFRLVVWMYFIAYLRQPEVVCCEKIQYLLFKAVTRTRLLTELNLWPYYK